MKNKVRKLFVIFATIILWSNISIANNNIYLTDLKTKLLDGGQSQILLSFSGQPSLPTSFSMNNPNKLIFDFTSVDNKIPKSSFIQSFSSGTIKKINFVESEDTSRMIIDCNKKCYL